jgi:hypothetical protein
MTNILLDVMVCMNLELTWTCYLGYSKYSVNYIICGFDI